MNPLIENLLVTILVAAAASYFVVPLLRRGKSRKACGSDCCGSRPSELKR